MSTSNLRICNKGHKYFKSSDCPTCPVCEKERKSATTFLSYLPAPARRALEREGITTVLKLSKYTEKEILKLHGIGPSSIPLLNDALKVKRLSFRKK
jgi:DNA-directed RNA polymerase alpha subunit